ncbi:MAG: hypothetical protein D6715_06720 [Calditrichaeota bacterium]|nr:MAG: hypothetical protein D6715_06720 [Calditrichota bacterium]
MRTKHRTLPLSQLVQQADRLNGISRRELNPGDCLVIKTRNSTYLLQKVGEEIFEVSGGWFERNGLSPIRLAVRGCTWGGSAIKMDLVAACGLHLEFGNNLITSPIQRIIHFPVATLN